MKRWVFFATAILLWASVLIGEGGLPRQGGTYRYTLGPSDPPSLDPVHITDTVSHAVASELFDGLVTFDQDLKIRPAIARQWVISEGGRTYTFDLRLGVRFHNEREVTAEDFRYSFERLLDPETHDPSPEGLERMARALEHLR